ncbi:hypothetical protein T484DRAFT_1915368, partial [Baffinella frigidus]
MRGFEAPQERNDFGGAVSFKHSAGGLAARCCLMEARRGVGRIVSLVCLAWGGIALAGSVLCVSASSPSADAPQRGEHLAIIYPAPGQCFPKAEVVRINGAEAARTELEAFEHYNLHVNLDFLDPGVHTAEVAVAEEDGALLDTVAVTFTIGTDGHCAPPPRSPFSADGAGEFAARGGTERLGGAIGTDGHCGTDGHPSEQHCAPPAPPVGSAGSAHGAGEAGGVAARGGAERTGGGMCNVAVGQPAMLSSTAPGTGAGASVDGETGIGADS